MHSLRRNRIGHTLVGLGLVLAWVVTRTATAGPAREPGSPQLAYSSPFDVAVPPRVGLRLRDLLRRPAVNRALAAPRQETPVELTYQTFEGPAFPPEGWQLVDKLSEGDGSGAPQFVWGRETCDVAPGTGGTAAVWAVGGGALGSELPCVSAYREPMDSWLIYGPVDTSAFGRGLQVNLMVKLDQPSTDGGEMQVCATDGPLVTTMRCIGLTPAKLSWGGPSSPIRLDWTGGRERVAFALRYLDRRPVGGVFGALADNVLLEGVPGPTPTATSDDTPLPTSPPTPSAPAWTPTPTPTATPPPTPVGVIHLPIVWRGLGKGVAVDFGVDTDENGELIQPGSVFQQGIAMLCAQVAWAAQVPGTDLHWQWYIDGQRRDQPGLSGDEVDIPETGSKNVCLSGGTDPDGQPLPLPVGNYEVKVFLNGASTPAASGHAVIQRDPPPGDTPFPSPSLAVSETPTETSTPEPPTATPTFEPGVSCVNLLRNADFEGGPRTWNATENTAPIGTNSIVARYSDLSPVPPPLDGTWLSVYGGRIGVDQELSQTWALGGALIEPEKLVSATIQVSYLLTSSERPNGNIDDYVVPALGRPNFSSVQALMPSITEELLSTGIQQGRWYRSEAVDIRQYMVRRPGWDTAIFVLVARNSPERPSLFLVDKVDLTVCTRSRAGARQP